MSEGRITREKRGHVYLIGIDRIAKKNALSVAMYEDLSRSYAELEADDELRCGVLFAHGGHFTAGLDLAEFAASFAAGRLPVAADGIDPLRVYGEKRLTKPLVCAVQGVCLTVGIELMLAADIRVASADTRFAQIEIKRGIYPVGGATIRYVREAGWGNAMRYLLTGDGFDAAEAYRIGLVQEVTEAGNQFDKAMEIAETIADQAPLAVRATLASSHIFATEGEAAAIARFMPDMAPIIASEDAREGVMSFIERRKAEFKGR